LVQLNPNIILDNEREKTRIRKFINITTDFLDKINKIKELNIDNIKSFRKWIQHKEWLLYDNIIPAD
jgi:hypothetical protein